MAGILAQRHPGPGLTLLGLVWLLDWPRAFSRRRSLAFFLAFFCAFAYAAWRSPQAPPVPEWLRKAASAVEDAGRELRPPEPVRIRARVENSMPLWENRARMILSGAMPAGLGSEKNGAAPGREEDAYRGGIVWTWNNPEFLPLPGQMVEATLRLLPPRALRTPGSRDMELYSAD